MTKLEALKELAAKVEAGTLTYPEAEAWGHHYLDQRAADAWSAYIGSLDAAKALDDALPTPDAVMSEADAKLILFGRNGARYWLGWKLRALIEMEEANA